MKLINVSQVPDYAATVKSIQDAQKLADASKPEGLTGAVAQLVDEVSEYEKRIETCKGSCRARDSVRNAAFRGAQLWTKTASTS